MESLRVLEFWYDHASTYSYPVAMRIESVAAARGVEVAWRPFLLGPATREAVFAGVFGAPTFFRGGEMFFGGDRLAQALAWPHLVPMEETP